MDFTNIDMSKLRRIIIPKSGGKHRYKLDYQVGVEFDTNEAVLKCFCQMDGKRIGVTSISYSELTS